MVEATQLGSPGCDQKADFPSAPVALLCAVLCCGGFLRCCLMQKSDLKTALKCSSEAHHRIGSTGPRAPPPRRAHAELLIALLNALIMRGGKRAWRRSIWLSIFISEATHQHSLIIFMNSAATDAEEAAELRFVCPPPPSTPSP